MSEHTPGPWKVFSKNGVLAILSPKEHDVVHWTGFDAAQFDDATNKANAAFIVKAVNSHPDLVKALRAVQFGAKNGKCPICAGWDMSSNGETPGQHTKDCIVGEALAKVSA